GALHFPSSPRRALSENGAPSADSRDGPRLAVPVDAQGGAWSRVHAYTGSARARRHVRSGRRPTKAKERPVPRISGMLGIRGVLAAGALVVGLLLASCATKPVRTAEDPSASSPAFRGPVRSWQWCDRVQQGRPTVLCFQQ